MSNSFAEIVILGSEIEEFVEKFNKQYLPEKIITDAKEPNDRPTFELKSLRGSKTTIFVLQSFMQTSSE